MPQNLPFNKGRNPQSYCIFCGAFGVTKEHIWPKWLRKIAPLDAIEPSYPALNKTFHRVSIAVPDLATGKLAETWSKGKLTRPGVPMFQTLRCVCSGCNNGWMSNLQTASKGVLTRLITGKWKRLSPDECMQLAKWVTMFVMVSELSHPKIATATNGHRLWFKAHQEPFPDWRVLLGNYSGQRFNSATYRWGGALAGYNPPGVLPEKCDTQSTIAALGHMMLCVFSSSDPVVLSSFDEKIASFAFNLVPIFPVTEAGAGRPLGIMTDFDFPRLHFSLYNWFQDTFPPQKTQH